jgi:hypothetical protein
MTEFDAVKALREELQGLNDIRQTIIVSERQAEDDLGRAEIKYHALLKLKGFCDSEITRKRVVLNELELKSRG